MKKKMELKESKAPGYANSLWDFFKLLEEMENNKERTRTISGELEGPIDSKADYSYIVKIGIERNDFPFGRIFHPRTRRLAHVQSMRAKNVAKRIEKER